ncbi:MAG TPA: hypothetical protein PL193_15005 [Xanthobacteraceae bacterium]|nr:hypothetical protein [Xanthobacteraceae bacterium]
MKYALSAFFAALLFASPAAAQNDPAKDYVIACSGPFGKNATHADLEKAFGKENVTYGDVPGPEGSTEKASIVFAEDEARRIEIQWQDDEKRARPLAITVGNAESKSRWTAPLGITLGTSVQDVQKITGKPFPITGFEWDLGGYAHLQKTKLEKLPGGCTLSLRFTLDSIPEGKKYKKLVGDVKVRSDDKVLLELKPRVQFFTIGYAE